MEANQPGNGEKTDGSSLKKPTKTAGIYPAVFFYLFMSKPYRINLIAQKKDQLFGSHGVTCKLMAPLIFL